MTPFSRMTLNQSSRLRPEKESGESDVSCRAGRKNSRCKAVCGYCCYAELLGPRLLGDKGVALSCSQRPPECMTAAIMRRKLEVFVHL